MSSSEVRLFPRFDLRSHLKAWLRKPYEARIRHVLMAATALNVIFGFVVFMGGFVMFVDRAAPPWNLVVTLFTMGGVVGFIHWVTWVGWQASDSLKERARFAARSQEVSK
jgi:hypothetical protein